MALGQVAPGADVRDEAPVMRTSPAMSVPSVTRASACDARHIGADSAAMGEQTAGAARGEHQPESEAAVVQAALDEQGDHSGQRGHGHEVGEPGAGDGDPEPALRAYVAEPGDDVASCRALGRGRPWPCRHGDEAGGAQGEGDGVDPETPGAAERCDGDPAESRADEDQGQVGARGIERARAGE